MVATCIWAILDIEQQSVYLLDQVNDLEELGEFEADALSPLLHGRCLKILISVACKLTRFKLIGLCQAYTHIICFSNIYRYTFLN